ncbi:MAG: hypothetical protein HY363_03065 [Candidatus Aenigmarchaeota archaeon]|nr:hypothetical protein [Candidatus Aenigmarchaeota archaeon]
MTSCELIEHELEHWISGDKLLEDKVFDYEQLRTTVGKFVHTIPTYAANGVARFAINITGEPDNVVDLAKLLHIAYFCHANCNKIVGGMPRIFSVNATHSADGTEGLDYYCKKCCSLLSRQIQL